jgi:hypothetical protein
MQPMTAHVNQLSWRRELPAMAPGGDLLIEGANGKKRDNSPENSHLPILDPGRVQRNLER